MFLVFGFFVVGFLGDCFRVVSCYDVYTHYSLTYQCTMAKRRTGLTSKKTSHPHKTKKRLEAKRVMLAAKKAKKGVKKSK